MSHIFMTNLFRDTNVNIIFYIFGQTYNLLTSQNARWVLILRRRVNFHTNTPASNPNPEIPHSSPDHLASKPPPVLSPLHGSTARSRVAGSPRWPLRPPSPPTRLHRRSLRRQPPARSSSRPRRHLLLLPALSPRRRQRGGRWRRWGFSARRTTRSEKPSRISAAASFRSPLKTLASILEFRLPFSDSSSGR
jgi:hypothetical protein